MAQKSITDFFKKAPNAKENGNESLEEKVGSKGKKRARILSSSSEDEAKPEKVAEVTKKKQVPKKKKADSPKDSLETTPQKESPKSVKEEISSSETDSSSPKKVFSMFQKDSKDSKAPDGNEYNPGKKAYHPINDAIWKQNEKVPYLALARTFQLIEETSGRLRMIDILSNYYRSVIVLSPEELLPSIFLCLNQVAPAHEGLELGIAETTLMKAIAQSTGRSMSQLKSDIQSIGDIGVVAEKSRSNQRMMFTPAPLHVTGVFQKLLEIAKMSGNQAMAKKVDKIQSMFVACKHSEARFLIRSLAGKLRIGLAEQSVLQAIAQACTDTPPSQGYPPKILSNLKKLGEAKFKARVDENALLVKTAHCECPDYGQIVPVLLKDGPSALPEKCKMLPGTPVKPMLAHPTKDIQDVFQRFDNIDFTCEWKYDGERAQIHIKENGSVAIFSRNQENNTTKYPDIIARIDAVKKDTVESCILDCEAVAWDVEKQQIMPFQVLSTRKRKDASETDIKIQVCVFMFDLLFFNGKPLVREPLFERRRLLRENFIEVEGAWKFATSLDTNDINDLQNFLDESVKGNCEGLMVKSLKQDATYEIAKRSRNWLKLKKDYLSGVGDSLDLVVIGGYRGKGRRTGTFGGFLLACFDPEREEYQSICKIGTGFSDEALQEHTEFLNQHKIPSPRSYYRFDSSHQPDDWFDAVQVWEVKCADLSLSPVHKAALGLVDPSKGISLRFPRYIRIRDDKKVEDATSAQQVVEMYSNQDQIKNQKNNSNAAEDDFY
ncbi:DNA ligase 1 isoform X2 [Phlebotomus argentipes]|uniref:DNA ligase 1 isoform X2 n=1 Tax=Phlebotomus argentipes TaxID=94469 RepID=UPI002892DD40|nr:DNA ligase 1 isoform X2 [Phlebotomus argentipes]